MLSGTGIKMARKTNVTGIPHLSVSLLTQNSRGYITKKYIVNYKENKKQKGKSFYFGTKTKIKDAFILASFFMIDNKLTDLTIDECINIFINKEHENRFNDGDKTRQTPKGK